MQSICVGFGINGDGADVEFVTGANEPRGDLATIGDKNFFKQSHEFLLSYVIGFNGN